MKNNDNLLLSLAAAGAFLVLFSQGAAAQSIYVQDVEPDDKLNWNLAWHQYMTGGRARWEGVLGMVALNATPPGPFYNTNAILTGQVQASAGQIYDTNNFLQDIMFQMAGPFPPAVAPDIYSSVAKSIGEGNATPYFNTNVILRNAFLGETGFEDNIKKTSKEGFQIGSLLGVPTGDKIATDLTSSVKTGQLFAVGKYNPPPDYVGQGTIFNFRCNNKFNPTDTKDYEGRFIANAIANSTAAGGTFACTGQDDAHVRQDRTLESLIGPLQYPAPDDMVIPSKGTQEWVTAWETAKLMFPTFPPKSSDFYKTYAAAGFCMNAGYYAFAKTPVNAGQLDAMATSNFIANQESLDSRLSANCWHFFEERLAYSSSSSGVGNARNKEQGKRCEEDHYNRHLISLVDLGKCQGSGRSSLKARADFAYRLDSPTYVAHLNTLGVVVRSQLVAQAYADAERFEQSLLLERQIMTSAMQGANRAPVDASNVIPAAQLK